jgi:glycine cleavage system H protein
MAQESYPEDLLYHPDHDWARVQAGGADSAAGADAEAVLGITWYAQEQLGEVVFFEAPDVGTVLAQGEPYTEVESVKAVSDVVAPLSGEIVAVNDALADTPGAINEDPYGEGWLVRVKLTDPAERERLLDAKAYSATLSG